MTITPTLWLSEQQANTSDSGPDGNDQREPQIVALTDGTFIVLWEDNSRVVDGDDGTDIIGQRFDAEGNKIGAEFQANSNRVFDDEGDFTAQALPNGNFVLVYEDTDANGTSIVFDIKTPTGVQVDSGDILNDPGTDILGDPTVAVAADGSFLVAYQRDQGANVVTEVVKVSATGVAGAPQLALSGSDSGFQTDVTALNNGNFVVVARDGGTDDAIAFRIVNAAGVPQGSAQFVANTGSNGDTDSDPTVTALSGGGFVVAWTNADGSDTDIQFQVFNATGGTVGGVGLVNGGPLTNNNNEAELVALPDGGFVVVYDNDATDTVNLQRFSAAGAFVGTEVVVTDSGSETAPRITLSDDGRLLVGWTTTTSGDQDVEVEIFDPRVSPINGDNTGETTTSRVDGATVNGNGGNDTLLGQGANDTLNGGDGDDVIRGRDGADLIQGGLNADTLFGDGGNDAIFANTQADPTGSGVGDDISGGAGFDTLTGSNGNDEINGDADNDVVTGGRGVDTLNGGTGDDTFAFVGGDSSAGEQVNGGTGTDRLLINSSVGFAGSTLTSIEEIEFAVSASVKQAAFRADQFGTGIAADAVIDANGTNQKDTLRIVYGTDTDLNLSLLQFQDFDTAGSENDRVVVVGDNDAETFVGSSVRDDINTKGGNDTLTGGGGADRMLGGTGDDTYFVDAQGEAKENVGQGNDTANSTVTYNLGNNVENLNLIGVAAINGLGNNLDNTMTGNIAANTLNGQTGNDTMTGGAGADRFVFSSPVNAANADTITDFQVGVDEIRLDDAVFAGLVPGALPASAFRIGAAAGDANDRIIYNSANGKLFFDADGNGAAAAKLIATLDVGLAMSAGDFLVI